MSENRTPRPNGWRRIAVAGAGCILALSACGGSTSDADLRAELIDGLTEGTGISDADAACVVDGALENHSLEELAQASNGEGDSEVQDALVESTTNCLLGGDTIEDVVPTTAAASADATTTTEVAADELPSEAEMVAFCDASADFWVAANLGNLIDMSHGGQVSMMWDEMDGRLIGALVAAPNDELAAPVVAIEGHISVLRGRLDAFDWDWNAFSDSTAFIDANDDVDGFIGIVEQLEDFLNSQCTVSGTALNIESQDLADSIMLAAGEAFEPVDDAPIGYFTTSDPTGQIEVAVPDHWVDQLAAPIGSGAELVVAPSVDDYLNTWASDGIYIAVADLGDLNWREQMAGAVAADECELVESNEIDGDGLLGLIDFYDCGSTTTAIVAGGASTDGLSETFIEVQFDNDTDQDTVDLDVVMSSLALRE